MTQEKLKQFEALSKEYDDNITKQYDERNKGSYFHHDWEINKANGGIIWDNGGNELIDKGRKLISKAFILYSPEFQELYDQIDEIRNSNNFIKAPLDDIMINLGFLTSSIESINSGRHDFDRHSSFELYKNMKGFNMYGGVDSIPTKYIWELGKMVFNQTRIEEISHACKGYTHWTCRKLDEILQNMHVEYFEDKKQELGEALAKEILTSKDRTGSAKDALKAIDQYRVKNESLIEAVENAVILETNHSVELMRANRKKESITEEYKQKRKSLLNSLGLKQAYS